MASRILDTTLELVGVEVRHGGYVIFWKSHTGKRFQSTERLLIEAAVKGSFTDGKLSDLFYQDKSNNITMLESIQFQQHAHPGQKVWDEWIQAPTGC
jgi:hypothetical protein